jgi:hypothetical protein
MPRLVRHRTTHWIATAAVGSMPTHGPSLRAAWSNGILHESYAQNFEDVMLAGGSRKEHGGVSTVAFSCGYAPE